MSQSILSWAPWLKPPDPKEQARKWKSEIRTESRKLDRQIRQIEAEELKTRRAIKDAAQRGDQESAKILAKEIVRSRKVVRRMHKSKAQMNSVVMQLQETVAQAKVMKHMQKSTQIMGLMNSLVRLPEISQTMQQLSKEMCKAGVIEELVDDAMGEDEEDLEEEGQEEVDKVLAEITADFQDRAGAAPVSRVNEQPQAEQAAAAGEEEEDSELQAMQSRLDQLRAT